MAWPGSFWPASYWPSSFWSLSGGGTSADADTVYVLTINGTERKASVLTFRIDMVLNGIDTGVATILLDDGSPTVRFDIDDEVVLTINGTRRWAGYVTNVDEDGEGGPNTGRYLQRLSLVGYAEILQRRHLTVSQSLGSPGSPGTGMDDFLSYLIALDWGSDGITLHPSQSTVAVLKDMDFEDALGTEILNRIATDAGLVWYVDQFKRLRVWAKGDVAAPFDIQADTDDPALYFGDIRTTKARYQGYANRVIVKGTKQTILDYGESQVSNGSDAFFTASNPVIGVRQAAVGATGNLTSLGVPDGDTLWEGLGPAGSGAHWEYDLDTFRWTRAAGALPAGAVVRLVYDTEISPRGEANDLTEQASYPIRDVIINAPVLTDADAQDLAETILPFLVSAKDIKAKYSTREQAFLTPGMDQEIVATDRNLSSTPRHLLTKVTLRTEVGGKLLVQDVDTTTGDLPRGDWRDIIAQFSAGVSPSNISNGNQTGGGSGGSGSTTTTNPGGDTNVGGSGSNLSVPPSDRSIIINESGAYGTHENDGIQHAEIVYKDEDIIAGGSPGSPANYHRMQMRLTTIADEAIESILKLRNPANDGMITDYVSTSFTNRLWGGEIVDGGYVARDEGVVETYHLAEGGGPEASNIPEFAILVFRNQTPGTALSKNDTSKETGFYFQSHGRFILWTINNGTGRAPYVWIRRNSSGDGAAASLALEDRDGTAHYLWVDAGVLRIGPDPPTENDSVSHTSGVVVGTQS